MIDFYVVNSGKAMQGSHEGVRGKQVVDGGPPKKKKGVYLIIDTGYRRSRKMNRTMNAHIKKKNAGRVMSVKFFS